MHHKLLDFVSFDHTFATVAMLRNDDAYDLFVCYGYNDLLRLLRFSQLANFFEQKTLTLSLFSEKLKRTSFSLSQMIKLIP